MDELGHVRWTNVDDPASFVRAVLAREAADIPPALYEDRDWFVDEVMLADLDIDRDLVARHDREQRHLERRDSFVRLVRGGQAIPPLIALGPDLRLVDGHAHYRALRILQIGTARVCRER